MTFDLPTGLAVLRRTPAVVRVLLADLPDAWLRGTEGPDTWSPIQVVGHLVDGERHDWMTRARIIRAQGASRRFEPYDRFRHLRDSKDKSLAELLNEFTGLRGANLDELEGWGLAAAQLALTGEHPAFGTVTMSQLLATWVVHDLGHLAQIERVMAKQYGEAVGPWIEYLPVLTRR